MKTLDQIAAFLTSHDDYLVLMHASPDGDTIGSATALCALLQQMGKRAAFRCADAIDEKYQYMLDVVRPQQFEPQTIIAVDVADFKLLGELASEYEGRVDVSIDHHGSHRPFAEYEYVNGDASANCENIFSLARLMGLTVSKPIADCLYTGISTDTGCFRYANTTADTMRMAADLMELGANCAEINRRMFETKSRARIEVERQALESIEFHADGKIAVIVITEQMQAMTVPSDLDGITPLPRQIEGVCIGITIKERENNTYKISVRTFAPYHAASICSHFGGGGHAGAAGCEMSGSLDEVKAQLLTVCQQELEKTNSCRD